MVIRGVGFDCNKGKAITEPLQNRQEKMIKAIFKCI